MKLLSRFLLIVLVVIAGAPSGALAQEHPTKMEHPAKPGDILGIAAGAGNFKTFVTAVKAAGLVEKLQGEGPFTIFAPTDEAFAKLPEGTLEDLLQPANKARLAGLLACHVVPGKLMAADIKTMRATNVNGQDLNIMVHGGTVTVDDAKVVKADLVASNGVIHGIDSVIVPAPPAGKAESEKPKDHPAH